MSIKSTPCLAFAVVLSPLVGASAQVQRLEPAGVSIQDRFGTSIDADASRLVVGTPGHTGYAGAVNVFENVGGNWIERDQILPTVSGKLEFGRCVRIHGDTIAVGAPDDAANAGAVHVFRGSIGAWTLEQRIINPGAPTGSPFGRSVSLEQDLLAVRDDGVQPQKVYVFRRVGAAWSLEDTVVAGAQTSLDSLQSVALDGGRLFIGGTGATTPSGAVSVLEGLGGSWTESVLIEPTQPPLGLGTINQLGGHLAVDGDTMVVGAQGSNFPGELPGAAVVFRQSGPLWVQEAVLTHPFLHTLGVQGQAVAIDGDTIVVSMSEANSAAYVRSGTFPFANWTRLRTGQYLSAAWGEDRVGIADGEMLTSAAFDSATVYRGGAVFSERILPPPSFYCTSKINSLGCTPTISFSGSATVSGPDNFRVRASSVLNNKAGFLIWGLLPLNAPFLGGTLCVGLPIRRTSALFSGGAAKPVLDCSGLYDFHFSRNYRASQGLGLGSEVYCQWWSRDQGFPAPNNVGLTDGLRFVVGP